MNISEQLNEIINLLKGSGLSNYIAICSLFVAIIAILLNAISSHKDHKQYIASIKPLLTFGLYEMNGLLLLMVKNVGKTEAKEIKLHIKKINNNGNNNTLQLDKLFDKSFMLYPLEEVQGIVALSGSDLSSSIFPVIDIKISFLGGNDNKEVEYNRTVTFKRNMNDNNSLSKIENSIESISYSNNRLANYIEGRTLFTFDRLNTIPNNSLFKDMKEAFNNVKREDDTEIKCKTTDI